MSLQLIVISPIRCAQFTAGTKQKAPFVGEGGFLS